MRKLSLFSYYYFLSWQTPQPKKQQITENNRTTKIGTSSPPNLTMISSRRKKPNASATTCLLYQQTTGGWPKNIYMPAELTEQEYNAALKAKENTNQSTIDNNATTTEIEYLVTAFIWLRKREI